MRKLRSKLWLCLVTLAPWILAGCGQAASPTPAVTLQVAVAVPRLMAASLYLFAQHTGAAVTLRLRRQSVPQVTRQLERGTLAAAVVDPLTCLALGERVRVLAVLAGRDGNAIVGHTAPPWIWSDLRQRTVLVPPDPSTRLLLERTVALFDIPNAQLPRLVEGPADQFLSRAGDFAVLPLPEAAALAERKQAYIDSLLGVETGPWPAALLVVPTQETDDPVLLQWLVNGVATHELALLDRPAKLLLPALEPVYPGLSPQALLKAVTLYQRYHVFTADPRLTTQLVMHLAELTAQGKLPYVSRFADRAFVTSYASVIPSS